MASSDLGFIVHLKGFGYLGVMSPGGQRLAGTFLEGNLPNESGIVFDFGHLRVSIVV